MITSPKLITENPLPLAENQDKDLEFYTMWKDRFSDTDDIEIQEKEVNELLAILRKPRTF